jgi:lipopolysaccharide export system protein LptA
MPLTQKGPSMNNHLLICLFLLLSPTVLLPEDNVSHISADATSYNDNKLLFSGNLNITHDLGVLTADKAVIDDVKFKKQLYFSTTHILNDVIFKMEDIGVIYSDEAFINNTTKDITFFSNTDCIVKFISSISTKTKILDTEIQGKKSDLVFNLLTNIDKTALKGLKSLTFYDDVKLRYNNFFFEGKKAQYIPPENATSPFYEGQIHLYPNDICLFYHESDIITSSFATIDLATSKIYMKHPRGAIFNDIINNTPSLFSFSSNDLFYHDNTITLIGDVEIDHLLLGYITTGKMKICRSSHNNTIKTLEAIGDSDIFFTQKDMVTSTISCNGVIIMDNDSNTIKALSQRNTTDKLVFKDDKTTIYSDSGIINYRQNDTNSITPTTIIMKDNVYVMLNYNASTSYGLADVITYDPITETIILKSNNAKTKRVLFWQDDNDSNISAKEVHIKKNPITKKEEITGVGHVRFAFNMEEKNFITNNLPKHITKRKNNEKNTDTRS